ncbi:MAG: hypothetical protein V1779_03935 [bacterium]
MKRIIALIIVLLAINNFAEAQKFSKIAEIKINTDELSNTLQYQSTQLIFQSKQKTDFHYSYDVMDIIKPLIDTIKTKDKPKLVFVFENQLGQSVMAGYSEFDNLITSLPAVLMYGKELKKIGDSLLLGDNKDGDVDMGELEEQFAQYGSKKRLHLQIKTITVAEKARILTDATIIFPKDLRTDRWISGVDKITIYKFTSDRVEQEIPETEKTEEAVEQSEPTKREKPVRPERPAKKERPVRPERPQRK